MFKLTSKKREKRDKSNGDLKKRPVVIKSLSMVDRQRAQSTIECQSEAALDDTLGECPLLSNRWRRSTGGRRSISAPSPARSFGPKAKLEKTSSWSDPASQRIMWCSPPLSLLVIKKPGDPDVRRCFKELATWLRGQNLNVLVEENVLGEPGICDDNEFDSVRRSLNTFSASGDLKGRVDLIICLGGDGTLLYASSLFQEDSVPPLMAFHLGSLGFLTPFNFNDYREAVKSVLDGNFPITLRSRLICTVETTRDEDLVKDDEREKTIAKGTFQVLNEVVIDRGPSPFLSNIDLYIDDKFVTSVQGDGLIVATPTGSTAYAAAAGASMIHPNVPSILVTPICPHSLSFRPIVVPAGVELKVMLAPGARHSAWASFDGRCRQELVDGGSVKITTSIYPVASVCCGDQVSDWFNSLASCLHWNVRDKQKQLTRSGSLAN